MIWPFQLLVSRLCSFLCLVYSKGQSIQRRDMVSFESTTRGTSKSSGTKEIGKSGMADHIWKEKGNHQPLWDSKIIDKEEHWKRRCLKEAAHMLGYVDLLSRLSIEMNTIWEPIIEKAKSSCFLK